MPAPTPSVFWRKARLLAGAFLVSLTVVVTLVLARDWFRPASQPPPSPGPALLSTPFFLPGLRQPPAQSAATADVPDDADVLGVSAGGRHRAYLVTALSRTHSHIVNHLLEKTPVPVTFCDFSKCARVFTDPDSSEPLRVDLGGIAEGKLLLRLGPTFYRQESGERLNFSDAPPFPYPSHPFLRTTWKKWKEAHPDTDVFVGQSFNEMEPPRPPDKVAGP